MDGGFEGCPQFLIFAYALSVEARSKILLAHGHAHDAKRNIRWWRASSIFVPRSNIKVGLGQWGMEQPLIVEVYERYLRPVFVRSMGRNWDQALKPVDEDQYFLDHIKLVHGPLLDLACGAGRWTRTLVNQFGSDGVVGLDLSYASLRKCRSVVPDILYVRGNAWHLPFADDTLEAINCSNSLQLIPNTPQVLKEVGRTLKPGGTFTCFTYRRSPPGKYRTFQHTLERILSIRAFALEDIESWLKAANMEFVDVSGPNLVLLFTARKIS
jgi:SAM-dependent methyltransferase